MDRTETTGTETPAPIFKNAPRPATKDERETLYEWLTYFEGVNDDDARELVNTATLTVFHYTSETPGYHGRLMLAVFSEPGLYELFKLDGDSAIEPIEKES